MENNNISTFEEGLEERISELKNLMISKHKDYGPGNINSFGELGVLVRTSDKVERLKHLMKSEDAPNFESMDDSWMDIANYGIIALMYRKGFWNLPLSDSGK